MKKYLLILFLSFSVIACDDKEASTGTPTISNVVFTPGFAAGTAITVFSFSITLPAEGSYTKLALWDESLKLEVGVINSPTTGAHSIVNLQLPWDNRTMHRNYFLWTKKDGTTLRQEVRF